jgi:hypothetical protein
LWTISEIGDKIMKYSSSQSRSDETFESVELPEKYFQKQSIDFINSKIYLPREFMSNVFQANISSNVSKVQKLEINLHPQKLRAIKKNTN